MIMEINFIPEYLSGKQGFYIPGRIFTGTDIYQK